MENISLFRGDTQQVFIVLLRAQTRAEAKPWTDKTLPRRITKNVMKSKKLILVLQIHKQDDNK